MKVLFGVQMCTGFGASLAFGLLMFMHLAYFKGENYVSRAVLDAAAYNDTPVLYHNMSVFTEDTVVYLSVEDGLAPAYVFAFSDEVGRLPAETIAEREFPTCVHGTEVLMNHLNNSPLFVLQSVRVCGPALRVRSRSSV
jgi:hypothetical protein